MRLIPGVRIPIDLKLPLGTGDVDAHLEKAPLLMMRKRGFNNNPAADHTRGITIQLVNPFPYFGLKGL
jgi:hypothetical protein